MELSAAQWFFAIFLFLAGVVFLFCQQYDTPEPTESHEDVLLQNNTEARMKLDGILELHINALRLRRTTLVRKDVYGIVDDSEWLKELNYFRDRVFYPALTQPQIEAFRQRSSLISIVNNKIEASFKSEEGAANLPSDVTPSDFEAMCCQVLLEAGWDAVTTKGSGDQGADVFASKAGRKIVLQCKLYTGVVGNKSVQEVLGAKSYYGADICAVVCNTSYTKSATQLANASGVSLLHFDDLPNYVRTL